MKQLLDTIGAFLYLGFSIVVAPVLLLARLFILTLIASKRAVIRYRTLKAMIARKQLLHFPSFLHLDLGRVRLKLHR